MNIELSPNEQPNYLHMNLNFNEVYISDSDLSDDDHGLLAVELYHDQDLEKLRKALEKSSSSLNSMAALWRTFRPKPKDAFELCAKLETTSAIKNLLRFCTM